MKAQVIERLGDTSVFKEIDLPKPRVIPGHILIRVFASSVNPLDYVIRDPKYMTYITDERYAQAFSQAIVPDLPAVIHGDVAGVVEKVGEGVSKFQPGDEVYACAGGLRGFGGALADYMLADADLVALKPKSLTMAEAAALPLVAITAWLALIDRVQIKPRQNVLVHAATGGVGHIGLQLAKWAGAKVFTTASSEKKLAIAYELGADVAINYRTQTVAEYVKQYTDGKGFDVVFDTVGFDNLDRSFEAAAVNGVVATTMAWNNHDLSPVHLKGITLHAVWWEISMLYGIDQAHHGEILAKLSQLIDEGKIRPLIDPRSFSFADIAAAHQYAESGQAIGKITLTR
ncbi:MAG: zinc-dependent alcohol dehydrogenase family protein [Aulosira sp. DedQUE10]|nr:zinc-dependent alcohol dehydrogenase family protein [Aulosira sp. DedQUE10]